MSARAPAIPFEAQSDPQARRDCGAACLRMVYSSLGKDVPQDEIWKAISKPNRFGVVSSTTHLMTKDAMARGLSAVAFQSRHPLQALRLCCESGARAIVNHRPAADSPNGHYSVLVDIDERDVILHDPFYGPARRVAHAEFLDLWRPLPPVSEIGGYLLIAIAPEEPPAAACWLCRLAMPLAALCPKCGQQVNLRPHGPLGCLDTSCVARMWNYICCPFCDSGFTIGAPAGPQKQAPPPETSDKPPLTAFQAPPLDLAAMFGEIDKFCNHVLTIPGAADNPQIRRCLDAIAVNNDKIRKAAAEAEAHQKLHREQLALMVETAQQNEEAHRKRLLEMKPSTGPLDGDALGRALMRNLGFIR